MIHITEISIPVEMKVARRHRISREAKRKILKTLKTVGIILGGAELIVLFYLFCGLLGNM